MLNFTDPTGRFHTVLLEETDSTLLCARDYDSRSRREFTLVAADYQTAGRGQRGTHWEAAPGRNLLFSIVAHPTAVPAAAQFRLSEACALAVAEAVDPLAGGVTVKWPNDIYAGDRKLCGMLIEHDLTGAAIATTVAGIGLNVNQTAFMSDAPNPVSLRQLCGHDVDRAELLADIVRRFCHHYDRLCQGQGATLDADYAARLYRRSGLHDWRDAGGAFRAAIEGVGADGTLHLRDEAGRRRGYRFKEVSYCLPEP